MSAGNIVSLERVMFLTLPPNPLGLHAFVPDFAEKAQNLTLALTDGRLRAIQAVAHAITH
jgi:sarcosine/dimethylglycine N-methyltransferase